MKLRDMWCGVWVFVWHESADARNALTNHDCMICSKEAGAGQPEISGFSRVAFGARPVFWTHSLRYAGGGPRDEAGTASEGEIGVRPIEEHRDPVPESDQKNDVDEKPREPRDDAADANGAHLRDRPIPPDCRHAPFVEIRKRLRGLVAQKCLDIFGDVTQAVCIPRQIPK